ncbi:hypothetical protein WMY93_026341 [Mugilogobius chulae]|uniref:Uncharacterized protein n=1 Tax=Mugilogobius chulae TaxID=88201 RepID=A0AAW0N2X4_9GOBI
MVHQQRRGAFTFTHTGDHHQAWSRQICPTVPTLEHLLETHHNIRITSGQVLPPKLSELDPLTRQSSGDPLESQAPPPRLGTTVLNDRRAMQGWMTGGAVVRALAS